MRRSNRGELSRMGRMGGDIADQAGRTGAAGDASIGASSRGDTDHVRRRMLQVGVFGALSSVLPLGACATFPFIPTHYTFTLPQIQQAVARRFPIQRRVSGLLDLLVDQPIVGTRPDQNRMAVAAHAHIESPLLQAPADGRFSVTSGVAYDAQRLAIVLRQPSIESLDFPDLNPAYRGEVRAALDLAVAQLLEGYPLHTFKQEELSFAGVRYAPADITVERAGVRVNIAEQT